MGKQNCWKFKKYEWMKISDYLADASYSGSIRSIPYVSHLHATVHETTHASREAGIRQENTHALFHEETLIMV